MSRFELPDGVSPTNEKTAFQVPDVATPDFAEGGASARSAKTTREKREVYERVVEQDDDDDDDDEKESAGEDDDYLYLHQPHGPNAFHIMILIALLLAALAAFVLVNKRKPTPLCSEQPEWNQYNCRAG